MPTFPILLTSAGRRCELIDCFRRDAIELGLEAIIIAADLAPSMSPACQLADRSFEVPRCTDPNYIDSLLTLCREHSVKLLVPTIDTELQLLSEAKSKFSAIGTFIGISEAHAVKLSQDKFSTAKALATAGVPCPRSCRWSDFDSSDVSWNYPLIFKPNSGSNSKGLLWAQSAKDIPEISVNSDYLVQECKSGQEFTINCYFRSDGALVAAVPHQRVEIRGGEVSKAYTRNIPELEAIAKQIETAQLGWNGPICFQAILSDNVFYVIEINARFGGGFPVAHRAGALFPRWLIQEALGILPDTGQPWKDGVLMLRYDTSVFLND